MSEIFNSTDPSWASSSFTPRMMHVYAPDTGESLGGYRMADGEWVPITGNEECEIRDDGETHYWRHGSRLCNCGSEY
jgi:hypothetical protein